MILKQNTSLALHKMLGLISLVSLAILPLIIARDYHSHHLNYDNIFLNPKILWIYSFLVPISLFNIIFNYRRIYLNRWLWLILLTAVLIIIIELTNKSRQNFWGMEGRQDGVFMHLVYLLLIVNALTFSHTHHLVSKIFILSGSVIAVSNILQQLGLLSTIGDHPSFTSYSGVAADKFGGLLGNRGYLGGYLAMLLPIAIFAYVNSRRNIFFGITLFIITWGWLGSFSRGAWLAGLASLIFLILIWRPALRASTVLSIALCTFAATTLVKDNARIFSLDGIGSQALLDSSGRTVLWNSALYGIKQNPLTGAGAYALYRAMNKRPDRDILREAGFENPIGFVDIRKPISAFSKTDSSILPPEFIVKQRDESSVRLHLVINKVHNEYLEYALTYGIPVALLFCALIFGGIWMSKAMLPGISAGIVAYVFYIFTWPEVIRFAPLAWFLIGMGLGAVKSQHDHRPQRMGHPDSTPDPGPPLPANS